ncbi:hypothetical protein IAR50_007395 [Cryptococcus sp. DSM 104548]
MSYDAIQDLLRGITEEDFGDPSSDPPCPSSPPLPPSSPPASQQHTDRSPTTSTPATFTAGRDHASPQPKISVSKQTHMIGNDDRLDKEVTRSPPTKRPRLDLHRQPMPMLNASSSGFQTAGGKAVPPPSSASRQRALKMFDEIASQADPLLSAQPPMSPSAEPALQVGFTTGRGKAVPPPSAAAQQRAIRLFDEISAEASVILPVPQVELQESEKRHMSPAATDERSLGMTAEAGTSTGPASSEPPPSDLFVGFETGSGKAVPPPSAAACQRASKLFEDIEKSSDLLGSAPPSPPLPDLQVGFKTGRGLAVPEPGAAAKQKAYKLFEDLGSPPPPLAETRVEPASGFKTGRGEAVVEPSAAARQKALSMFEDMADSTDPPRLTPESPAPPAFQSPAPQPGFRLGSGRLPPAHDTANMKKVMSLFGEADNAASSMPETPALKPFQKRNADFQPATPTRTPLSAKTNTYSSMKKPIQIKTPASQVQARRIGLGSTPAQRSKRGFVTPFRSTRAPDREVATPSKPKMVSKPVFDLTRPQNRLSLKQAFLHPQYYSQNELTTMDIPLEIITLRPDNAASYQFAQDQSTFGPQEALEAIKECGCSLATFRWVQNHWTLILWKLAGTVQAKPELYEEKWNAEEVTNQLRYRYEREFGAAQRPLIRRIQEHDSSPSLPLVLAVSAVHRFHEGETQTVHIDLTDGWYHIQARIDDCLKRAVEKGKICVGRKLAVTGAKLESGSDGAEVLDAYKSSRLIVSGNSTSLARWDTRLGMQPHPFVASLSSLAVDGGIVTLMDVVIEKIFPMAFTSGDRTSREPPWDEEEERCRQDQWKKQYNGERGRQEEELRKEMDKLQSLGAMLAGYAEEADPTSSEPPDSIEDDLEELLECKDAPVRIRKLASHHIAHLALCARSRLTRELEEGRSEIDAQLQTTCPPREVRDFRIVRFRDAEEVQRDSFRTGMLNVWDARGLGEGTLKEGGRYLVSNLMPGKSGDWRVNRNRTDKAEVYLHTRRDTRWQVVNNKVSSVL